MRAKSTRRIIDNSSRTISRTSDTTNFEGYAPDTNCGGVKIASSNYLFVIKPRLGCLWPIQSFLLEKFAHPNMRVETSQKRISFESSQNEDNRQIKFWLRLLPPTVCDLPLAIMKFGLQTYYKLFGVLAILQYVWICVPRATAQCAPLISVVSLCKKQSRIGPTPT